MVDGRAPQELSRSEMREALLNAGWSEETVHAYLKKIFKEIGPDVILRVNGLSKKFGPKVILNSVDFDIRSGEIFGIIGASGVGKTTLLNLLVGFLKPDTGEVTLALPHKDVANVSAHLELAKKHIGFSTQTPSFYPRLTVRENLEHFAALYGISHPEKRGHALLELVGLSRSQHLPAAQLSGGMQKRLDIACALLHDPTVLILDEPTADLDPVMRQQLWDLITQINRRGTTIVLSSHFLDEIELLCHRIAIIHNAGIAELGTTEELKALYSRDYEITYRTATEDYSALVKELKTKKSLFSRVYQLNKDLVIETPTPEKVVPIITKQINKSLDSLHVMKPSLGKIFETVLKK